MKKISMGKMPKVGGGKPDKPHLKTRHISAAGGRAFPPSPMAFPPQGIPGMPDGSGPAAGGMGPDPTQAMAAPQGAAPSAPGDMGQ